MAELFDFGHERALRNAAWTRWSDTLPPENIDILLRHPSNAGEVSPLKSVRRGDDVFTTGLDGSVHHLFGPYDILEWTPA